VSESELTVRAEPPNHVRFSAIRKLKRLHGRIVGYSSKWNVNNSRCERLDISIMVTPPLVGRCLWPAFGRVLPELLPAQRRQVEQLPR
jgi:hypothetical protein